MLMLEDFWRRFYYTGMKNKIIFTIFGIIACVASATAGAPAFADDDTAPPIFFRAVNAGYKDDISAQNYDFFELEKRIADNLDLSEFHVQYFNSSDKLAGELEFADPTILRASKIIFGFNKSPQYADFAPRYLYNFGSSGLASTAGRLKLMQGDTIIDEICWGKLTCDNAVQKFATAKEENRTALRCREDCVEPFVYEQYYPEIDSAAIYMPEPEPEQNASCAGLQITEIYSYYEENSSEQFIELYNDSDSEISLGACTLRYKNKNYPLLGVIAPKSYSLLQDILLTKDPSSSLTIELLDTNGQVFAVEYYHGQKKATSYALLDGQ